MKSTANGKTTLRKLWLQDHPSELQERLMGALSQAGGPLSSAELAKSVGLETKAVHGYRGWLLKKEYVAQHRRKVARMVGDMACVRPEIFWSLPAKGREYLARRNAPGSRESSAT